MTLEEVDRMSEEFKVPVTAEQIRDWADGAVQGWLPGYADPDEETGRQYKITRIGEGAYEVADPYGPCAPRRFRLLLKAVELP